jgi:hypothetical protein
VQEVKTLRVFSFSQIPHKFCSFICKPLPLLALDTMRSIPLYFDEKHGGASFSTEPLFHELNMHTEEHMSGSLTRTGFFGYNYTIQRYARRLLCNNII